MCDLVSLLRAVCVHLVVTVQNRKLRLQIRLTWMNSGRVRVSVVSPGVPVLVPYPNGHLSN